MATTAVDGRTARALRTRAAVVRALLALVQDGNARPTAREIAERAGVSLRSVYVHFDDLDDLFASAAREHLRVTATLLAPIDGSLPPRALVAAYVEQRSMLYEEFGAVRRAALAWAPRSAPVREAFRRGQAVGWHDTVRLFGDLLAGPERDERLEAVDAAAGSATWDHLRIDRGRSVDAARRIVTLSILGILEAI
jgi:AcrR family transcriptional regulator